MLTVVKVAAVVVAVLLACAAWLVLGWLMMPALGLLIRNNAFGLRDRLTAWWPGAATIRPARLGVSVASAGLVLWGLVAMLAAAGGASSQQAADRSTASPVGTAVAAGTAGAAPSTAASAPTPTLTAAQQRDELTATLEANWSADWPAAIEALGALRGLAPDAPEYTEKLYAAHLFFAERLWAEGELPEAQEQVQQALALDPSRPEAKERLRAIETEQADVAAQQQASAEAAAEAAHQAERRAFLDYGRRLWALGQRSDRSEQAFFAAMELSAAFSPVQLQALARRNRDTQQALLSQAVSVTTTDKGNEAKQALLELVSLRKDIADRFVQALDSRNWVGTMAPVEPSMRASEAATLRFTGAVVMLAQEFGVDYEAEFASP